MKTQEKEIRTRYSWRPEQCVVIDGQHVYHSIRAAAPEAAVQRGRAATLCGAEPGDADDDEREAFH